MKKIYGFAFASAIMMLASCSNENEPTPNPNPVPEGEVGYIAFNIAAPGATRAGFEDGQAFEQAAKTATFLFFDAKDRQTQIPQEVQLEWTNKSSADNATPNVENISSAVVAVAGRDGGDAANAENSDVPGKPTQVIVILNDPGLNLAGKDKTTVLAQIAEADQEVYSLTSTDKPDTELTSLNATQFKNEDKKIEGKFIMTNATYVPYTVDATTGEATNTLADKAVIATPIDDSQVYPTRQKAAEGNKVNIYVERLAARINVVPATGFKPEATAEFQLNTADGINKIQLVPVIKAIGIANVAEQENFFKVVDPTWKDTNLFDPNNYRVNWATTPASTGLANQSYNNYTNTLEDTYFYVKENTLANEANSQISKKTSLLITAELQLVDEAGNATGTTQDLIRWAGIYYTKEAFQTQGLNFLKKYSVKTTSNETTSYRSLTDKDVTFSFISGTDNGMLQYESCLQVALKDEVKNASLVIKGETSDSDTAVTVNELNATLKEKNNRCWYWQNGQTYYFVEIGSGNGTFVNGKDSEDKDIIDGTFSTGVVRNNAYKITLTGLAGLGIPVFNPAEEIIPQTPKEELFYVAAQINILKWRLISQDANINQVPL